MNFSALMQNAKVGALLVALVAAPNLAQSEDSSRGVRIIDGPAAATPTPEVPPTALPPAAASPAGTAPQQVSPPSAVKAPQAPAASSAAILPSLPAPGTAGLAVSNPADLSIEIVPGPHIPVGSRVSFRISTKKAGYLILLDVDSTGKLTQIYPNPGSLLAAGSARPKANYVQAGKPIQIPSVIEPGFEFIATPPLGTAMVVAVLSDQPVQIVDLPDIPMSIAGQAASLTFLSKLTTELRIPSAGGDGRLQQPRWSVDAKFYSIAQAAN